MFDSQRTRKTVCFCRVLQFLMAIVYIACVAHGVSLADFLYGYDLIVTYHFATAKVLGLQTRLMLSDSLNRAMLT